MSVQIIHGANAGYFPVEGLTIEQVIRQLRDVLNIPSDASASVNGRPVDHGHVIGVDDKLEFVRCDGQKGGVQEYWAEYEVTDLFGCDAVAEMKEVGIEPVLITAYTSSQIASFQAQRVGNPEPTRHGLIVDHGSFAVSYRDQASIELGNSIPFFLFARLARRPNVYVQFNTLKLDVWNDELTEDTTITRAVSRLRKQLQVGGINGITLEAKKHAVRLKL